MRARISSALSGLLLLAAGAAAAAPVVLRADRYADVDAGRLV